MKYWRKDEPIAIDELFATIKPDSHISKSLRSLRIICNKDARLICFRKGTMIGLKKWEATRNLKRSPIRDMVNEFLQQKSDPIHIDEITKYLKQYLETNSASVYANLKADNRKRFKYYYGKYFGLASKKYPGRFLEITHENKSTI